MNSSDYFRRVNYPRPATPSVKVLQDLHLLHTLTFPFENLSPLFRIPVLLDIDSIADKFLHKNRGGYCFEHNLLLKNILEEIGFKVKGLAARVVWNIPEGVVTARGHMLLLVETEEGPYIADAGFGGQTLTAPLKLQENSEQCTSHEPFRLIKTEEEFILQSKIKEEWKSLYRFSLQEQFLPDYEVTNWYLSNHPSSHFVTGLIAARPTRNSRVTLRNNDYTIHHLNGKSERRTLDNVQELRKVLTEVFGIKIPDLPQAKDILERMVNQ